MFISFFICIAQTNYVKITKIPPKMRKNKIKKVKVRFPLI